MFFCEECRKMKGWPQSYGGSYGNCEICGNEDSCYDVPSKLLPIPMPELGTSPIYDKPKRKQDIHTAHCCQKHGCKYALDYVARSQDCTVIKHGGQEQMCSYCHEELYEEGEWETAHLLNEMFDKGRRRVWAEVMKLSHEWTVGGAQA